MSSEGAEESHQGGVDTRGLVIITGLPDAKGEKIAQLAKVTNRRLKDAAKRADLDLGADAAVDIPTEDDQSQGVAILKLKSDREGAELYNKCRTVALDKKNILRPTHLPLAQQLLDIESTDDARLELLKREEPRLTKIDSIKSTDRSQSRNWIADESQREMLLVRAGKETLVMWWDPATGEPVLQCDGEEARKEKKSNILGPDPVWTNMEAFWSPQGTYLCTVHPQGVRLWTGDNFAPVARIQHREVKDVLFSPDERFVVTSNGNSASPMHVRSVASGELLSQLQHPAMSPLGDSNWPLVAWSHDSNYLAASSEEGVSLWSLPRMEPLRIPESITGGRPYLQFAWQPNSRIKEAPVLALWIAAQNADSPCRLTLIRVPTMEILSSKNLFAVDNTGIISWQKRGDHCGLQTKISRRVLGKPKVIKTQMEVFRMRERNLPVDSVEFEDDVLTVFWSDAKNRFAVLTASSNKGRKMVFYTINHRGTEVTAELDVPREMNAVIWSPLGSHFVVASVGTNDSSGLLWFCQCNENEERRNYTIEISYKDEMSKLQAVQWDPSGRFVVTSVSTPIGSETAYRYASYAGYAIWSFQGRPMYHNSTESLHSVTWRPHPPTLLTSKELEDIKIKMKDYSKRLEASDQAKRGARKAEMNAKKAQIYGAFMEWAKEREAWIAAQPGYAEWRAAEQQWREQHPTEDIEFETAEEIGVAIRPTAPG